MPQRRGPPGQLGGVLPAGGVEQVSLTLGQGLDGYPSGKWAKNPRMTFACATLIAPLSTAAAVSGRSARALPRLTIWVAAPEAIRVTPDSHEAVEPAPRVFAVPRDSKSATSRIRNASKSPMRWHTARVASINSDSPKRHTATPPGSANTTSNSILEQ